MNKAYKVIHFDKKAALKQAIVVILISLFITIAGDYLSKPNWVKESENFVLFFPVLIGILLFGFSVSSVFQSGKDIWQQLLIDIKTGNDAKIQASLENRPDIFPIALVILGWVLLAVCALYIQIPNQMRFMMFLMMIVITTPVAFAIDYWGFDSGIKRIELINK